jgi:hypothetical protein
MRGKRAKWIRKELLQKKNVSFMRKLIDFCGDEHLKSLDIRKTFRLSKKLWNRKIIRVEDIVNG